jgi:hypothetical protein
VLKLDITRDLRWSQWRLERVVPVPWLLRTVDRICRIVVDVSTLRSLNSGWLPKPDNMCIIQCLSAFGVLR